MSRNLLEQTGMVTIIGECTSAPEAYNFIMQNKVDVLLLDIEMPEMSGLDLLKLLPEKPVVIFFTSKPSYAADVFELYVADYIVKPITLSRLISALQKAKEVVDSRQHKVDDLNEDFLYIKENKSLYKMVLNDILWIEAMGDYVKFCTAAKKHIVYASMRELETRLNPTLFTRVHRGYIVSINKIDYIQENLLYINGNPIPISESFRPQLIKKLNLL